MIGVGVYTTRNKEDVPANASQTTSTAQTGSDINELTIFLPKDFDVYRKKVLDVWNNTPPKGMTSDQQLDQIMNETVWIATSTKITHKISDLYSEAATKAAEFAPRQADVLVKVRLEGDVAHADLQMDGWLGSSFSVAMMKPLIKKNLLQFSNIKKVIVE